MKNLTPFHLAAYILLAAIVVALALVDRDWFAASGQEDQLAEYATAALYLASSMTVFAAYLASRSCAANFFGRSFNGAVWLLLLAAFFFICFGEEISWAQRIVGWDTPETWKAVNGHGETNLHNILDPSQFSNERILTFIALSFGVLVPLADRFSDTARRALKWLGIPVPPLATAGLFVFVFVTYRFLRLLTDGTSISKPIREYSEAGYAAAYFVVAVSLLLRYRHQRSRAVSSSPLFV